MPDYSKERWDAAIGFLMNAFGAPYYEDADDEVDRSWRSIAYHMMEYADKEHERLSNGNTGGNDEGGN